MSIRASKHTILIKAFSYLCKKLRKIENIRKGCPNYTNCKYPINSTKSSDSGL